MLSNTVSIACSAQQLRQHPTPRLVIKPTTAPSPHNIACATLVSPDAYIYANPGRTSTINSTCHGTNFKDPKLRVSYQYLGIPGYNPTQRRIYSLWLMF